MFSMLGYVLIADFFNLNIENFDAFFNNILTTQISDEPIIFHNLWS